ncbi:MAG: hypothetical protein V1899_06710 [Planctomycetota bacterium]
MNTDRQRLAIVMGKCFAGQPSATRDALRHAVVSQVLKCEIKSFNELADSDVKVLLEKWEHWQAPFNPSDSARIEINAIAREYQLKRGQTEMIL